MDDGANIVDWVHFEKSRTELGPGFIRILAYFREDGAKSLAAIEEAMHEQNTVALVIPAHTLIWAAGVKAAAEIYWQKDVSQLGWSEAALLTALIRNPVGYDPINFPEIALERHHVACAQARGEPGAEGPGRGEIRQAKGERAQ